MSAPGGSPSPRTEMQALAKLEMRYRDQAPTCGTCRFFTENVDQVGSFIPTCTYPSPLFTFTVRTSGCCDRWEGKVTP